MTTRLKTDTFRRGYFVLWIILALSAQTRAATEAGPFQNKEDAALYFSQLEQPFTISERAEQVPTDYIIVSPALGPLRGKKLAEDLTRKDIEDVVYVRTGEFGGRVSAGVYLRRGPSVQRRIKMLSDEGFQFEPFPRDIQVVNQYWISSADNVSDTRLASMEQHLGYAITFSSVIAYTATDIETEGALLAAVETTSLTEESEDSEIQKTDNTTLIEPLKDAVGTSENEIHGFLDNPEIALVNENLKETNVGIDIEVSVLKEETSPAISPTYSKKAPNTLPKTRPQSQSQSQSQQWHLYLGILFAVAVLIGIISIFVSQGKRTLPAQATVQEPTPDLETPSTTPPKTQRKATITDLAAEEGTKPTEPSLATSQPDPVAASLSEIKTETTRLKGKDWLDQISDQVILAQNDTGVASKYSFDLAVLLLATVNEARSLHHISPIKYRPTSFLPHVFSDAQAIQRMLSIVIDQSVSFDDAAHILIQAEYKEGRLTITCLNESALLNETELQQFAEANIEGSLRLKTAETLATRMQGHMTFASKFGTGTKITLTIGLPLGLTQVMLKDSEISGIAESRMRLIKNRKGTVPTANAGLDALESMLSPATIGTMEDLKRTDKLTNAITAMSQQLKTVELAEQQAVAILETILNLAYQNHINTDEAAEKTLAQVAQIATELNRAKPSEQPEPTTRAFPPYGSTDSSHEFFTQLKSQVEEIETARALGDLQSLSRVARWTAKYADGLGMILVAKQFRTMGEAIRKGDELRMLEALTTIHIGLAQLNTEGAQASKLA